MKNELLTKGIILPSGEIGKNKINLVAGAITQPFAEMVWVTTGGDMETINRLTNVLVTKKKSRFGGMSMNRFTVEETNLLSIYHEGSKAQLIENMTAALPYMDAGLRELAKRTLSKVNALTDAEYKELSVYPADEV